MAVKLTLFIAWLAHAGSCLWFFLATNLDSSNGQSWKEKIEDSTANQHMYLHGVYWAVTTMFSGSSFMPPSNAWESIFAAVYIIMSALFVTSITSTLAAILIESQMVREEFTKKIRHLTTFMDQQNTPPLLAIAVREDFIARISREGRITEHDIPYLSSVSAPLRAALRYSHYGQHFLRLPLFRVLDVIHDTAILELCSTASTFVELQGGESLFQNNQVMPHAILMSRGSVRYSPLKGGATR
eukprot:4150003-Amphidinium_carterae.1